MIHTKNYPGLCSRGLLDGELYFGLSNSSTSVRRYVT